MSCLTVGLTIDCANACAGGFAKFWVASKEDVTALNITGGEIDTITMSGVYKVLRI
jgi:hypothetical protein